MMVVPHTDFVIFPAKKLDRGRFDIYDKIWFLLQGSLIKWHSKEDIWNFSNEIWLHSFIFMLPIWNNCNILAGKITKSVSFRTIIPGTKIQFCNFGKLKPTDSNGFENQIHTNHAIHLIDLCGKIFEFLKTEASDKEPSRFLQVGLLCQFSRFTWARRMLFSLIWIFAHGDISHKNQFSTVHFSSVFKSSKKHVVFWKPVNILHWIWKSLF